MTLAEVVMSMAITAMVVCGSINGYIFAAYEAEWSAYSLAAQSLANQRLEQVRAAKWDMAAFPPVDLVQSSNFPPRVDILDVPLSGTNIVYATTFTTITPVSSTPPYKLVSIQTVWTFVKHGTFTNTVISYRAPDQ